MTSNNDRHHHIHRHRGSDGRSSRRNGEYDDRRQHHQSSNRRGSSHHSPNNQPLSLLPPPQLGGGVNAEDDAHLQSLLYDENFMDYMRREHGYPAYMDPEQHRVIDLNRWDFDNGPNRLHPAHIIMLESLPSKVFSTQNKARLGLAIVPKSSNSIDPATGKPVLRGNIPHAIPVLRKVPLERSESHLRFLTSEGIPLSKVLSSGKEEDTHQHHSRSHHNRSNGSSSSYSSSSGSRSSYNDDDYDDGYDSNSGYDSSSSGQRDHKQQQGGRRRDRHEYHGGEREKYSHRGEEGRHSSRHRRSRRRQINPSTGAPLTTLAGVIRETRMRDARATSSASSSAKQLDILIDGPCPSYMSLDDWNRFRQTLVFERDRALFKQKYSGFDAVDSITDPGGRKSSSRGRRGEPKRLFDSDSDEGGDDDDNGDKKNKTKEYMKAVELSTRSIAIEDYKRLLEEITTQGYRPRIKFTEEELEEAPLRTIQGARYENFNGYIRESTVGNYGKTMSWGANMLYTINKYVGSPIALSSRSEDTDDAAKLKEFRGTVDKLVVDSRHQLGRLYEERAAAVGGPEYMQWSPYVGLGASIVSTAVNLDLKNRWGVNVMEDPMTAGQLIIAKPSGPPEEKKMSSDRAKAASSSAPTKEEAAAAAPAPPKPKQQPKSTESSTHEQPASSSSSSEASESAARKTAAALAAENRDRNRKDKVSSPLITESTPTDNESNTSSSSLETTSKSSAAEETKALASSTTTAPTPEPKSGLASLASSSTAAPTPKPKSGLASFYANSMKTL